MRTRLLLLMLVVVATAGLYLPALGYEYVFDDLSLLSDAGEPVRLGGVIPYRPVRYVSYFLDSAFGPASALVSHAVNLVLHGVISGAVFWLSTRFGAPLWAAAGAALLFGWHPLTVESVVYVAGRRDLLAVFFGMAAVLAWFSLRSGHWVCAALLVLAVGSKETGLLFFPPLVAAALLGVESGRSLRRLATTLVACVGLALAYGARGPWFVELDPVGLAGVGRTVLHYAAGLISARPLSVEYPALLAFQADPSGPWFAASLAAVVFLMIFVGWSFVSLRRVSKGAARTAEGSGRESGPAGEPPCEPRGGPPYEASLRAIVTVWLAVSVLALGIFGGLHEPGADRHLYPVLAVAAIAVAVFARELVPVLRPLLLLPLVVVLFVSASSSRARMEVWENSLTLWQASILTAPQSPRVGQNLAAALAADGRLRPAARQLRRTLRSNPELAAAHLGRAALLCHRQAPVRARKALSAAFRYGAGSSKVGRVGRDCGLAEFEVDDLASQAKARRQPPLD